MHHAVGSFTLLVGLFFCFDHCTSVLGLVARVGPDVHELKEGDAVSFVGGAFAEYVMAPAPRWTKVLSLSLSLFLSVHTHMYTQTDRQTDRQTPPPSHSHTHTHTHTYYIYIYTILYV